MITKIIWPKCRLMDGKNAFWVGCTDDEVSKNILPLLSEIQGKAKEMPVIRYYDTRESILKAYKESLNCKN